MKVFVDTNVLLDVLTRRKPFYRAAVQVWSLAERGEIRGFISVISFNNIYYIVRKTENKRKADRALCMLRDVFESIAPDRQVLNQSIDSDMDDFEDAVQFHSAVRVKAAYLVTRNPDHFPTSCLPVMTPDEFLTMRRTRLETKSHPSG